MTMVPATAVLSITALFLIAITSGRAYAVHKDPRLLMQAEDVDAHDNRGDADLAGITNPTVKRAKKSFVGHDLRAFEFQIRHAIDQAPDGTCELKFYGAGVVAVCE